MEWEEIKESALKSHWNAKRFVKSKAFTEIPENEIRKLANMFRKLRRFSQATQLLQPLLSDKKPAKAQSHAFHLLGEIELDRENYKKAAEMFTSAITISNADDIAFNNRALAFLELGLWDKALADYQTATKLNPKNYVALRGLGEMYLVKKQYGKSKQAFKRAVDLVPDYQSAQDGLRKVVARIQSSKPIVFEREMRLEQIDAVSFRRLQTAAHRRANQGGFEVCGAIIRQADGVLFFRPLKNLATQSAKWEINTSWLEEIRREVKDTGERLVGAYHSHVGGYAYPSGGDIEDCPFAFLMMIYDTQDRRVGLWEQHLRENTLKWSAIAVTCAAPQWDKKDALQYANLLKQKFRHKRKRNSSS